MWALTKVLLWFILAWQACSGLSDAAIGKLLTILNTFLDALSKLVPIIHPVVKGFPSSVSKARSLFGIKENFTKYVVCSSCHCLYKLEECYEMHGRRQSPRKCPFVEFPLHPQPQHRQPCSEDLLKSMVLASGKELLVPKKLYCYRSVIQTLRLFIASRVCRGL